MPIHILTIRYISLSLLLMGLMVSPLATPLSPQINMLSGHIVDPTGLPVGGAQVILVELTNDRIRAVRSGQDGRFEIAGLLPGSYEIRILAKGLAEHIQTVELRDDSTWKMMISLRISTFSETVTVTPSRREQKLGDLAKSVNVLNSQDIQRSPAVALDNILRQIPSFSLFRRTSSLAAHPTSQGVSLRGIGPSGVSRTLVLLDNFPFNDPFGGWVYWSRVPISSIERIEIVEGPSSNIYGNFAMGGVIHILTQPPQRRTVAAEARFGNRKTAKLDFFASDVWGPIGLSLDGTMFHTDGYKIIAPNKRGQVDINANTEHENFNLKLEYNPSSDFNIFVKGSYFDEDRSNGTSIQQNNTQWRFLGGGLRFRTADNSEWQVSLFSHFQNFGSNFSAVTSDRNSERLALSQEVPTFGYGGLAQWTKPVSSSHVLTAGLDWRWIDGESQEIVFIRTPPRPVRFRDVGGRQRMLGFFLQDSFTLAPDLQISLSARFDHWKNHNGTRRELAVFTGKKTQLQLSEKDNALVSGRIGLLHHLNERVSLWGAIGSGFRAPTLNELYRQFRVGSVTTRNNPDLGPERLIGFEGGLNLVPNNKIFWRVTGFWNRIKDPVSNVTLTVTPNLITRKRQNLGETRVWGIQSTVQYHPTPNWIFDASYLFNDATVKNFTANPIIEGNHLAQVPRNRLTLGFSYDNPNAFSFAVHGMYLGEQFDDDLNQLPLEDYFVVDATISRRVDDNIEIFLAVENLFDNVYPVRTNPNSIGTPLLIQGGIRFKMQGR
ncbi:MAG: TonB-dependent receptor [Acidobacteriota bacterium]|nr:TonB-dependent receptor [Acidobacteriota bacterium]